jgi:hypothetical protein
MVSSAGVKKFPGKLIHYLLYPSTKEVVSWPDPQFVERKALPWTFVDRLRSATLLLFRFDVCGNLLDGLLGS